MRAIAVCRESPRQAEFRLPARDQVEDGRAPAGVAPIAIGLGLTLIHLISIPVTNTSVNPARSTGPALIVGGIALQQLWLFWVAPLAGGVIGGFGYRALFGETPPKPEVTGDTQP